VLLRVAQEGGHTPAQVALARMLQRRLVTSALIGARTPAQLDDNLKAGEVQLAEAQLAALDAASRQPAPYPYSFIERYTRTD
jgi:aryl-alcohol dehydrogenase-like predicted oxidoreductase